MESGQIEVVVGDLLDQRVDVIVNSWNRNIIPWWLLIPQGVSGAIKNRSGTLPFKELARFGPMPLGSARMTSAGKLNFKAIIHVAGINMFWRATEYSIRQSVQHAMSIVNANEYQSVAFPLIGAGSGQRSHDFSMQVILGELETIQSGAKVKVIKYSI